MAFTNAERVKIRQLIGFPSVLLDRNSRLESAMDLIGADVDGAAAARAIMVNAATTDAALLVAQGDAGLKRAEDLEWYQSEEFRSLSSEGRRYCSQLSMLFGVPLVGDYYGTGGYRGDDWAGSSFQYGGAIPLG